jgi:hypothetical protein
MKHTRNDDRGISEVLVVILVILGVIVISAGGWALKVALSGAVGQGNSIITKNDSTNRISQNSVFYDLKTDYDATVAKIPVYAQAAKGGDVTAKTNLVGLRSHCITVTGEYAAQSGKFVARDFKDTGLPESLDPAACSAN